MSGYEIRVGDDASTTAMRVNWSTDPQHGGDLLSDLDPWLTRLGLVPDTAIDLVRLATAVYVADLRTARGNTFTRTIEIDVELSDVTPWSDDVLDRLADLLSFLTGDAWRLSVTQATGGVRMVPPAPEAGDPIPATLERVALLSGGLDSLAGAVVSSTRPGVAYLGHWDQSVTKAAQDAIRGWFARNGRPLEYVQIRHGVRHADSKRERSMRSRAFLFMSLGVALASARGAHLVEVPENGFTSLNPPLTPDRRGALSTRSTHPWAIASTNALLAAVAIDVEVVNPYAQGTKGELVRTAVAASPGDFAQGAALTLSCAKLNGNWIGGNPNHGCGLCFADLVRRGALLAAGLDDATAYNADVVTGKGEEILLRNRRADLDAVEYAVLNGISDTDVIAFGPFPDDFDIEGAVDLCRRGLGELDLARQHVG
jgi:7-cyano-7-deazaguanine synthase in queuosine biosynthesis